jgi:hypothetical protein
MGIPYRTTAMPSVSQAGYTSIVACPYRRKVLKRWPRTSIGSRSGIVGELDSVSIWGRNVLSSPRTDGSGFELMVVVAEQREQMRGKKLR